jgi:hypothetical protein
MLILTIATHPRQRAPFSVPHQQSAFSKGMRTGLVGDARTHNFRRMENLAAANGDGAKPEIAD